MVNAKQFLGLALLAASGTASAVPIGLGSFSSAASLETFETQPAAPLGTSFTVNGVTYGSPDGLFGQSASFLFTNIQAPGSVRTVNTFSFGQASIDFGSEVLRAGLLLSSASTLSWRVTALDSTLNVLESAIFSQPPEFGAVFAGFENLSGIRRLDIELVTLNPQGWFTFFDDVRWEGTPDAGVSVSEPGSLALMLLGLAGLGRTARRKLRA